MLAYKNLSWVWGADRKILPRDPVGIMRPNSNPEGRIFLFAPNKHDRFIFLHTFWSQAFDFNIGVAIKESRSYTLTSAILKVDIVYVVTMTSTPSFLTAELHDLLYNQCIGNTCCYSFLIYPTGRIRVCKIRFASTGKNRGKPCLVCKKYHVTIEQCILKCRWNGKHWKHWSDCSLRSSLRSSLIRVLTICPGIIIWKQYHYGILGSPCRTGH